MADDATWTGDSKYWPPDVKRATDVIRRWLLARKKSAQLKTDMFMTVGAEGLVDIHFDSLDEIYNRGRAEGLKPGTREVTATDMADMAYDEMMSAAAH